MKKKKKIASLLPRHGNLGEATSFSLLPPRGVDVGQSRGIPPISLNKHTFLLAQLLGPTSGIQWIVRCRLLC